MYSYNLLKKYTQITVFGPTEEIHIIIGVAPQKYFQIMIFNYVSNICAKFQRD